MLMGSSQKGQLNKSSVTQGIGQRIHDRQTETLTNDDF